MTGWVRFVREPVVIHARQLIAVRLPDEVDSATLEALCNETGDTPGIVCRQLIEDALHAERQKRAASIEAATPRA